MPVAPLTFTLHGPAPFTMATLVGKRGQPVNVYGWSIGLRAVASGSDAYLQDTGTVGVIFRVHWNDLQHFPEWCV